MSLIDFYDSKTESNDNNFTEKDVADALQAYEDKSLVSFPINSIVHRSGLLIQKNKRNGRKQKQHIQLMNYIRDEINGNSQWWKNSPHSGRKSKKDIVIEWREKNPTGRKIDCIRDTQLSKPTVYKWWK